MLENHFKLCIILNYKKIIIKKRNLNLGLSSVPKLFAQVITNIMWVTSKNWFLIISFICLLKGSVISFHCWFHQELLFFLDRLNSDWNIFISVYEIIYHYIILPCCIILKFAFPLSKNISHMVYCKDPSVYLEFSLKKQCLCLFLLSSP